MLYWFWLNHLSPKVNWCTNKSEVKYPSINTGQVSSVRHDSVKQEVPESLGPSLIPTGGNFFAKFILLFSTYAFIANVANFV